MISIKDILTTVIAAIIASIVAYLSTKLINERNHEVKYVTQEREDWRKDIKEKTSQFCSICSMGYTTTKEKKEITKLKTFIIFSLNPFDTEDQKIVYYLNDILSDTIERSNLDDRDTKIKALEISVALLLKHDWERVKENMGITYKQIDRTNKCIRGEVAKKNFFMKLIS